MDLLKGELGSSSEACVTSTVDGNEVTGKGAERVLDMTEVNDKPTTIPVIKTEPNDSMGLVEGETGYCSETGVMSDVDGTEEVSIKVEDTTDIKEEVGIKFEAVYIKDEIPETTTRSPVESEHEDTLNEQLHVHSAECRHSCDMYRVERPYLCAYCNKAFNRQSHLIRHQRIHSGKEVIKRWGNIRDCYVKLRNKHKDATKSGVGSSKYRKYVYSEQFRFLSKLINKRPTDNSLVVDNMEEYQVTRGEQNRDCMNNLSQETPFRKPQTQKCGNWKRKPDEFELRIMKALEEGNRPNRHLSFFKGIIPSLQNFNEEETLELQMGVLQLIANIKHRKPSNVSSRPLLVYNQPFHTSSHVGGNNPLLMYASTMNSHLSNITKVQPPAVETGMVPLTAGQEPAMQNPSLARRTPNQTGQHSQRQTGATSSTDRAFTVRTPSPSLSVTSNHTDCSIDITCV